MLHKNGVLAHMCVHAHTKKKIKNKKLSLTK